MRKARIHWYIAILLSGILITSCNNYTEVGSREVNVLAAGTDVPLLLSEIIAGRTMASTGLNVASMADYTLHTIQAVDLYGNPFLNLTFALPSSATDIWDESAVLEPGDDAFTVITGARTIHDVLIGYSHDLNPLRDLQTTVAALGGLANLDEIVASTANSLLVRDTSGSLWDAATHEILEADQVAWLISTYDEIVGSNNTQEFIDEMQANWDAFEEELLESQAANGFSPQDVTDAAGGLDLQVASVLSTGLSPATFTDYGRQCGFLGLFCSHRFTGSIPQSKQAVQGGFAQMREDYFGIDATPIAFNSIACGVNNPVNDLALLGCGPSAFIGLVGEKFKNHSVTFNGKNSNNTSLTAFKQWLVAPTGPNGRPRIPSYMGTCVLGTNYEGFTTLSGFTNGAQDFLSQSGSGLTIKYSAGIGGSTGFNQSTAATMVHLQVGVYENPVVATYWPNSTSAHYSPITHYDILWSNGVAINIRTIDGGTIWYNISSHWSGQIGVYYLE